MELETREGSGQEMWLSVCLFWEVEHIWSWRRGKHSEGEFPAVAWLVGNVHAQPSPRDAAGALSKGVLLQGGQEPA